jgi:hypothetical protein
MHICICIQTHIKSDVRYLESDERELAEVGIKVRVDHGCHKGWCDDEHHNEHEEVEKHLYVRASWLRVIILKSITDATNVDEEHHHEKEETETHLNPRTSGLHVIILKSIIMSMKGRKH